MKNSDYLPKLGLYLCVAIVIFVVAYVAIVKFPPVRNSKAEVVSSPPPARYTNIDLPPGTKLVNAGVTSSGASNLFWYVVRPMREGEVPETHKIIKFYMTGEIQSGRSKFYLVEHDVKGNTGQSAP